MSKNQADSLGDRMKRYESVSKTIVIRRTPVIIRLDGRAFHTFVRKVRAADPSCRKTPFSEIMHDVMTRTTQYLVQNVQNCVFGYTQSDEISLMLRDWDFHETEQWFDGGIQKMASISASMASNAFNFFLDEHGIKATRVSELAQFDSRVYNLPKEEVTNYFIWRQQDASRNSVQMLGHFHFSQKQMHAKNNSQVQDMLMLDCGVNWNNLPTWMKRGTCISNEVGIEIDDDIPMFTQDRNYVERHLTAPAIVVQPEVVLTTTGNAQPGVYTHTMTVNPTSPYSKHTKVEFMDGTWVWDKKEDDNAGL